MCLVSFTGKQECFSSQTLKSPSTTPSNSKRADIEEHRGDNKKKWMIRRKSCQPVTLTFPVAFVNTLMLAKSHLSYITASPHSFG